MGNLQQEHNFNTNDTPNGLGIVQWIGDRRNQLIQRGNWESLETQLDYLVWELENTEQMANWYLKNSDTLESATIAFENLYERCNPTYCMRNQRIAYAQAIYKEFTGK